MNWTKLRNVALLTVAVPLAGCITLAPRAKPVQMYTFGASVAAPSPHPGEHSIGVLYAHGGFQDEAAGDRVLTMTGDKAAYIAETRWVSPAVLLFRQAVASAFDRADGRVRLDARGQRSKAPFTLRLDVRNFETRYATGRDAAPTVVVRIHAVLTGTSPTTASEQVFVAEAPATSNRVGPIVLAYDEALGAVLGDLVSWTRQSVE